MQSTKERVLALLRYGERLSGQQLGDTLGVSRAAVCKAIAALKRAGYEVDAVPHLGYRLLAAPDVLSAGRIAAALSGCPWAELVRVVPEVDSTNNALKALGAAGAPEGSALLAQRQSAGRGRKGRSFDSPAGAGLYLSVLLRPHCPPQQLMNLTALTAVAVRRALCALTGIAPDIKWVNDLQLNGRKLCGILTELSIEAESGQTETAVIGIGINCTQERAQFPATLQDIAGSVYSETGQQLDRNLLAAELIRALWTLRQLPEAAMRGWMDEYRRGCSTLGRDIWILRGEDAIPATALDVGEQGELLVRYADGTRGVVNSGEVSVRNIR